MAGEPQKNGNRSDQLLAKWLDKLQEDSWNLELLISGFSIYGLFQLRDYIAYLIARIQANSFAVNSLPDFAEVLLSALFIGVQFFIFFLLIHIFLRGLWIGAIGLRYVSGDIDYDQLHYNNLMTTYLKRKVGRFDHYIHRLEQISSLFFAMTFLLFFIILSIVIYYMFVGFVYKFLNDTTGHLLSHSFKRSISIILLTIGALVGVDFLTMGWLKRIKWTPWARFYLIINRLVSGLTLSFIWRPLYYNFIDDQRTKKVFLALIPTMMGLIYLSTLHYDNLSIYPENFKSSNKPFESVTFKGNAAVSFDPTFYDDLREKSATATQFFPIRVMSIPSRIITSPYMEVFVPFDNALEEQIKTLDSSIKSIELVGLRSPTQNKTDFIEQLNQNAKERKRLFTQQRNARDSQAYKNFYFSLKKDQLHYEDNLEKVINVLPQIIQFKINDQPIDSDALFITFMTHSNLGEKGFLINFYMDNVNKGGNRLTQVRRGKDQFSGEPSPLDFTIPFIYSPK